MENPKIASIAIIEKIPVPFLQTDQLIANKKAVGCSKDQVDVMELENIIRVTKKMDDNN